MKKEKVKRQFRLYDIYRYIVTDTLSNIEGIVRYDCNKDASTVTVNFVDPRDIYPEGLQKTYFTRNEEELKAVISKVNKRLGNCRKPGKKI